MQINETSKPSEGWIARAEHTYEEHESAVNLSLLAIVAIGAGGYGLKNIMAEAPETFAEVGTNEFNALQDSARLTADAPSRPLQFSLTVGNKNVLVAPSVGKGACVWRVAIPDELSPAEPIFNGTGEHTGSIQRYGDMTLTRTDNTLDIERPDWGLVSLRTRSSTARVFGANGKLRLVLNPVGDEIRYDTNGQITGIARNVHRTLDLFIHSLG